MNAGMHRHPWRGMPRWLVQRLRRRPFQAFQIEVTTRCTLACTMCPRTALRDDWPETDLPWEAFAAAARAFDRVRHVHLQGWGEPLLHPRLAEMVGMAKAAGCHVGLTTNGSRLDAPMAEQLLDQGIDLVAISIAGATPQTHARIRVGSELPALQENIARFVSLRGRRADARPKVELAYLMTRANLPELPAAVEMAGRLGVDELYATNLDFVPGPEQEDMAVFGPAVDRTEARAYMEEAARAARRARVRFRPYPLEPQEVSICEARPLDILFISADGSVSPCTYMGLPQRTTIPRRFAGASASVPGVRFGNVLQHELLEIWASPAYAAFRAQFADRIRSAALSVLDDRGRPEPPAKPPAPDVCRCCYKLYGI
jgi:MoaA/NifB/PqqE/SkfB family radical SAM enzyme